MKLLVELPDSFRAERAYACDVVLREFLGVDYELAFSDRTDIRIFAPDGQEILIADGFFRMAPGEWLTSNSLPRLPLTSWSPEGDGLTPKLTATTVPVLFGRSLENGRYFQDTDSSSLLGLDIFGSAFFMLSRYEEAVLLERDQHDRFPARASIAVRAEFLERPIIDEYVEILWCALLRRWPGLSRKQHVFAVLPSHDVDLPFRYAFASAGRVLRAWAGDVLKRRRFSGPLQWARVRRGNPSSDPFNTFDRIMRLSEKTGYRSTFFFICGRTVPALDADYEIEHPWMMDLLKSVHARGHEVGLHTSYGTYRDAEQTQREFQRLARACEEAGVKQEQWGARQHYLRWTTPQTFRNLAEAGLDYDTTLSFAQQPGFRCGTSLEYQAYDVASRQPLRLRERPLIVMECSVTDDRHLGMGLGDESIRIMLRLKEQCRRFSGQFTLLWHNNTLDSERAWDVFRTVLAS